MFCIKCGRELEDEANFCPACGTRCSGSKTDDKFEEAGEKNVKKSGKALKILAAALLAVAILSLVVFLIVGFGSNKNSKSTGGHSSGVSSSVTTTAKPEKSSPSAKAGSGLTTKDELKDKYEVKSTPKPKATEKPKATPKPKSGKGSGLVTMDELKDKYKGFDSFSGSRKETEQVSGATQ